MEDRLKGLRKAMQNNTFNQLNFTEQHRVKIRETINKQDTKEEDMVLAIMNLLAQEKTGCELAKSLRSRGIQNFEDHEGLLYTVLHRLEKIGYLQSRWDKTDAKFYLLTDKGRKIVRKLEKQHSKKQFGCKELLEG